MNNGKAFSSLDGMTCSYQCFDQFQFLPGHWRAKVLETLKNQANLFKNNPNNTRNKFNNKKSLKFNNKRMAVELWN